MKRKTKGFGTALRVLSTLDERVTAAAARGLKRGLEGVVTIAQREFLSGPRPQRLDVRTRRLRGSITSDVRVVSRGVVGRIGSNVRYARFHEFGFRGQQSVRSHTRVTKLVNGRGQSVPGDFFRDAKGNVIGRKRSLKEEASRLKSGTASVQFVKAHQRKVNYAGRPFIAPAVQKGRTLILTEVRRDLDTIQAEISREGGSNG